MMKQILTAILLFCTSGIFAQTTVVSGQNKKQQTTTPTKPKPVAPAAKPQAKQQTTATKPKQQKQTSNKQPSLPPRTPQELSTETFYANGVSFKMCYVKGGTFLMGATSEQGSDASNDEKPAHRVTISDYYIGQTEVTQALWQAVMGSNPSNWKGDNFPVEFVSWDDCQQFISKLNSLTGRTFRLPTEAQWEFAARGGNNSRGYKYSGSNSIDNVAVYEVNSYSKGSSSPDYGTHAVATKQANELGIYDMSGNVWEWCQDWKAGYSSYAQTNPTGPSSGSYRVFRGGCWNNNASNCRVSHRNDSTPDYWYGFFGLRLVLLP